MRGMLGRAISHISYHGSELNFKVVLAVYLIIFALGIFYFYHRTMK